MTLIIQDYLKQSKTMIVLGILIIYLKKNKHHENL